LALASGIAWNKPKKSKLPSCGEDGVVVVLTGYVDAVR